MKIEVWHDVADSITMITLSKGRAHLTHAITDQELEMSKDPRAYLSNALERLINEWNLQHSEKVPPWWAKKAINAPFNIKEDWAEYDAVSDRPGDDDRILHDNEEPLQ